MGCLSQDRHHLGPRIMIMFFDSGTGGFRTKPSFATITGFRGATQSIECKFPKESQPSFWRKSTLHKGDQSFWPNGIIFHQPRFP